MGLDKLLPEEKAKILDAIKAVSAKRVLVQAPEGFKVGGAIQKIAAEIENTAAVETIIWIEPCFGACDVPYEAAQSFGCGLIVHLGHADFGTQSPLPVVYVEKFSDTDPIPILEAQSEKLRGHKSLGLVSPVQHVKVLPKVKAWLKSRGIVAHIGEPPKARIAKLMHAGQILGCNVSTGKVVESKVDAFLYVGGGRFHPYGLLKQTKKPVLWCDLEMKQILDVSGERDKLERRRLIRQAQFKDAKRVAIVATSKHGQMAFARNVFDLKKKLEAAGKEVWVLAGDMITPEKLAGVKFDAMVNAACPRIEDDLIFPAPIINAADAMNVLESGSNKT